MKSLKPLLFFAVATLAFSCISKDKGDVRLPEIKAFQKPPVPLMIDRGFSEFISGYTSGVIPSRAPIEIRFTPEFAAKCNKTAMPLFDFKPELRGKTEWKDEVTLVFTPARPLESGKSYTGTLNLARMAEVQERLSLFPIRIQAIRKDFRVTAGSLEASGTNSYKLSGEISTSDIIDASEIERFLKVKSGRKELTPEWDHSSELVHRFTVSGIERKDREETLEIQWNGQPGGVKQKGSLAVEIPRKGDFRVLSIKHSGSQDQKIDVVFSDPVDSEADNEGLFTFSPASPAGISVNSNIVSLFPAVRFSSPVKLTVDMSVRNTEGLTLGSDVTKDLDFSVVPPSIELAGKGVIVPSSQNLVFPFRAASLRAVDLKIIKIYENNLPFFLQESDLDRGYGLKRFGRPVWSGRVDLVKTPDMSSTGWNLHTIDLSDYINVEPGVLYKITLGMRRSYSTYPCAGENSPGKYEELLDRAAELTQSFWDDPEGYFDDEADEIYYNSGFSWRDRDNPCLDAYYSPDRKVTGTILASNFGIIAKMGEDKVMNVIVSDLLTALPVNEASVEIFDYQLQPLAKGATSPEGTVALRCERKPFLVTVKKDKDRNYLRTNDGSSLSMSSFDVGGARPEKGIKAYVFGERDVWRPGDSIFLSVFVKDMKKELPPGHPVEFELFNPLDQRVDNQVQAMGRGNLLLFTTSTAGDAMTGNYRAVFRIGGASFTRKVRVETIKPNRLKINLSFPQETLGGKSTPDRGTLNARWLSGSKVSGFRASVEYILRHSVTEFKGYSQYIFDDPVNVFMSETVSLFNSTLDGEGNASVSFKPALEAGAPGMLNAVFTARVMEPGGDESITQSSYKYAPYTVFAGISLPDLRGKERTLFTDRENTVKIVTLDAAGKPVTSSAEISVYKLEYKWWWETDQENLGYFISNNIYKPILTQTVKTPGGEATYAFSVDKKDWGRYLIRVSAPGGHSTGKIVLIDWPWEYGMKAGSTGATMLSVSTDKEKYSPGDEVRISFPSPPGATAIVTIENATGVLEQYRSPTGPGTTEVKFRAKPGMAPNVYAYVSVIQPHAQSINDMPVRLYGVVPVMIEDSETRLSPVIDMDKEVRSMKPFVIKVSEAGRKPMNYMVAVVDEGLLDITSFRTPDPWNHFFAREALGVKTWDLYDYVLGAFGGTLDRLFSVGGDEALVDRSAGKAQRFKPVVRILGPFALEPGKTRSHAVTLPQYTGSVRTMVIAGSDNAFGSAEKTVTVSDPLMVLVTAPRVVSPGDRAALPVTLFVKKNSIRDVTLNVTSNDLVTLNQKQLTVNTGGKGETEAQFELIAGSRKGVAKISVVAEGDGEKAVYDLELEVRSPEPPETRSETRLLKPGEKWETVVSPLGMEGSSSAFLELSQIAPVNFEKWSSFLADYPHYCSEQLVSAAFPRLLGGSAEGSRAVSSAIGVLISRQMYSGGLALWPGAAQPDTWVTSYAGHFLAEAERAGYSIPQDFRQKWVKYQSELAREWKYDPLFRASATDQAYRLFTLALSGTPDRGAMNRLRENGQVPALSKWLLAAAYAVSGRPEAAEGLIDVRNLATETGYQDSYFGSALRDKAVILYTLTLLGKNDEALQLVTELSADLMSESWYSTQSVSWGLFAWAKWSRQFPMGGSGGIQAGLTLNGASAELKAEPGKRLRKELDLKKGNNQLTLVNTSQNPLHATLTRKGVPEKPLLARQEKGLSMKVSYTDKDFKPVNEKNLVQGSDMIMIAKITNTTFTKVGNVALTQMVPAGWEIRNTRLFDASYGISESPYDYRDIRDDRVCTYFGLNPGEQKTFIMVLNPAYRGEFSQPSVWCEAMYTPGYYSGVPGARVLVRGTELE